jgi:hypothetical protein
MGKAGRKRMISIKDSIMKIHTLGLLAAAALLAGCAGSHHDNMGGSSDTDHNVLTGGPISGTTLKDLPGPVKQTLRRYEPNAEVSDIEKLKRENQVVYRFTFMDARRNPPLYIMDNGGIWWESSVDR